MMETMNQPLRGNSPSPPDLVPVNQPFQTTMGAIGLELHGSTWLISQDTMQAMLEAAASSTDCQDFLDNCSIYQQTRDAFDAATCEEDICEPAAKIIQSVLDHFGLEEKRTVVTTHSTDIEHQNHTEILDTSVPLCTIMEPEPPVAGLLITGTPQEFDYTDLHLHPWVTKDIGTYTTCLTPIDVNTKNCDMTDAELLCQAGIHARGCFNSQQHRMFVYALAINQEDVRLYYFDHCGAMASEWMSFKEDPKVLIRMILLTCNAERDMVGLDPAVSFVPTPHRSDIQLGQQYQRRIQVDIGKGEMTLIVLDLMFSSDALHGRKTVCWRVKNEQGDTYILRESSRLVSRTPTEWEVLEKVNNDAPAVTGVGKMVGHMERFKVSELREKVSMDIPCGFPDRERYYVLLEPQGPPITHFKDPLQLLRAFRDAVAGHQKLWNLGILHRNINTHSILLGDEHASEGNRGVLANLDLATFIWQETTHDAYGLDFLTMTHAFQSLMVLDNLTDAPHFQLPHDHLDDLESFFWVLVWITQSYEIHGTGNNVEVHRVPDKLQSEFLTKFESVPTSAASYKFFILFVHTFYPVSGWDLAISELLSNLCIFFDHKAFGKSRLQKSINIALARNAPKPELPEWVEAERPLAALKDLDESKQDYQTFLGYIDQAISASQETIDKAHQD